MICLKKILLQNLNFFSGRNIPTYQLKFTICCLLCIKFLFIGCYAVNNRLKPQHKIRDSHLPFRTTVLSILIASHNFQITTFTQHLIIKRALGFIRGVRLCLVFGQLTEKEAIKIESQDKHLGS